MPNRSVRAIQRIFERTMIPSKNFVFVGLAFWVLSAYPLQAKDIVISTSSMTLTSVPYLVAIEKKFFEKEGLAAQYVGGHTLLPLGEYMETLLAGAGVSQKKLEQNRDEVKRVVRALLRSLDFMQAQPVEVKNLIQKRLGVSETDIVDHIYGLVTKYATRNGIASQKAIENTLLGTHFEGKLTNFDKLTDFSVAREVADGK